MYLSQVLAELNIRQQSTAVCQQSHKTINWAKGGRDRLHSRWEHINNCHTFIVDILQDYVFIFRRSALRRCWLIFELRHSHLVHLEIKTCFCLSSYRGSLPLRSYSLVIEFMSAFGSDREHMLRLSSSINASTVPVDGA